MSPIYFEFLTFETPLTEAFLFFAQFLDFDFKWRALAVTLL